MSNPTIIKITEGVDKSVYYLLSCSGHRIELRSRADKKLELSWISDDAAAFRLALEACEDEVPAIFDAVKKYAEGHGPAGHRRLITYWTPDI